MTSQLAGFVVLFCVFKELFWAKLSAKLKFDLCFSGFKLFKMSLGNFEELLEFKIYFYMRIGGTV